METKITQEWFLERLYLLNTKEIERQAGLTAARISDVKRGRVKLSESELARIQEVLKQLK